MGVYEGASSVFFFFVRNVSSLLYRLYLLLLQCVVLFHLLSGYYKFEIFFDTYNLLGYD